MLRKDACMLTGTMSYHVIYNDVITSLSCSAMHEFQNLHAKAKEKIHDFVRGHFYGWVVSHGSGCACTCVCV